MSLRETISKVADRIATMWRRGSRHDERITAIERKLKEGQGKNDGQAVPPGSTVFQDDDPRLYRRTGTDSDGNTTARIQTIDANGDLVDDPDDTTEYTLKSIGDDVFAGVLEGIDENDEPIHYQLSDPSIFAKITEIHDFDQNAFKGKEVYFDGTDKDKPRIWDSDADQQQPLNNYSLYALGRSKYRVGDIVEVGTASNQLASGQWYIRSGTSKTFYLPDLLTGQPDETWTSPQTTTWTVPDDAIALIIYARAGAGGGGGGQPGTTRPIAGEDVDIGRPGGQGGGAGGEVFAVISPQLALDDADIAGQTLDITVGGGGTGGDAGQAGAFGEETLVSLTIDGSTMFEVYGGRGAPGNNTSPPRHNGGVGHSQGPWSRSIIGMFSRAAPSQTPARSGELGQNGSIDRGGSGGFPGHPQWHEGDGLGGYGGQGGFGSSDGSPGEDGMDGEVSIWVI